MHMQATFLPDRTLPVTRNLAFAYLLSFLIAVMMSVISVAGLLYPETLYPDEALQQQMVPNDLVNLFVGLPLLLGALWLARRGRLVGLLFWPGALFYTFYNALVYTIALPVNAAFVFNLLLVVGSTYTVAALVASIDAEAVRQRLAGAVPERLVGATLMGLGFLFTLLVAAMLSNELAAGTTVTAADKGLHIADLIIAPALALGGFWLWRREALGYVTAAGLLFLGVMLFVGLIAVLLVQPLMTTAPFRMDDLIAVTAMSLFCFVPFAIFLRSVWTK